MLSILVLILTINATLGHGPLLQVFGGPIAICPGFGEELIGDPTYTLFRCDLTWEDARTKCNAEDKVLVAATGDILNTLKNRVGNRETFWTAGTNRYKNEPTVWEWVDHGLDATQDAKGQQTPRNCLVYENGDLKEKDCYTVIMNFVCVGGVTPKQVGPRKNLAFTQLINMNLKGHDDGCAWRAVDEDGATNFEKNTCATTADTSDPWIVLSFGSRKAFSEVVITGRSETETTEMPYVALSYFKLAVADHFDWENFNPESWTECGSNEEEFASGERKSLECKVNGQAVEAAYLAIYGWRTSLQICNLEVYN